MEGDKRPGVAGAVGRLVAWWVVRLDNLGVVGVSQQEGCWVVGKLTQTLSSQQHKRLLNLTIGVVDTYYNSRLN